MQIYSKRFMVSRPLMFGKYRGVEENSLLTSSTRLRLVNELRYIISCGSYIENFLLIRNPQDKTISLNDESITNLFHHEIGYDITNYIDVKTLAYRENDKEKLYQQDSFLLDLLEIIIIFSRESERQEVCERVQEILSEENSNFQLNGHLVFPKDSTSLRGLVPLIKSPLLKRKLLSYYSTLRSEASAEVLAQISADLVQFIFSSESDQKSTKKVSEKICSDIAHKWTHQSKVSELEDLLDELVKIIKNLNNRISDIRHTDQHTISVQSSALYKLISDNNIHLTETVIQTLPDQFIVEEKPGDIKVKYLTKYNIDPTKLETLIIPVDDEIPF